MKRIGWDDYFLGIAKSASARADCTRREVGAVLTLENRTVATGYNGAPAGMLGCASSGACPRGRLTHDQLEGYAPYVGAGECIAVHAESNAFLYVDERCPDLWSDLRERGVLYVTDEPCEMCWETIQARGIPHVIWPGGSWSMDTLNA